MKLINLYKILVIFTSTVLCYFSTSTLSLAETVPGTDYDVHFESANIVGAGRSINMYRVPVILNTSGTKSYYDVVFKFTIDNNGQLIFDSLSSLKSVSLNSGENFIPGTYQDEHGNKFLVSGGGVSNGRTTWSATSLTADKVIFHATWATGTPKNHPLISKEDIVEKLLEGPSYGVIGDSNRKGFFTGGLIGATQAGNAISISAYHGSGSGSNWYTYGNTTFILTPAEQ